MLHDLLAIEGYEILVYFILPIAGVVLWFYLLRSATRADEVVKNQKTIINMMTEQLKKQGVTEEEMQTIIDR